MDADGNAYGPYDIEVSGSEAEALTEEAWFDLFEHLTGVKSGGEISFTGLTATLTAIDVRVHGSYLIRQDPWSAASTPTATASPRRDMLVARRQRTSGEGVGATPGKTFLTLLVGTPAATPADPASFDPASDEPLWSWQVPASGGTVVTDIRDRRQRATVQNAVSEVNLTAPAQNINQGPTTALRNWSVPTNSLLDYNATTGVFTVKRSGLWVFNGEVSSDDNVVGRSVTALSLPGHASGKTTFSPTSAPRATGYTGAGQLTQPISAGPTWMNAGDTFSVTASHSATDGGTASYWASLQVGLVG